MASSSQDAMAPVTTSRNPFVQDESQEYTEMLEDTKILEDTKMPDTKMPDASRDPPAPNDPRRSEKSYRTIKQITDTNSKDYYGILGLEKTCTPDEIKKQYKKLSKLTHPDKNDWEDAELAFKLLSTAHDVLTDPSERRAYDKAPERYLPPERPFGEEFGPNAFDGEDSGSDLSDVSDDEVSTTLKPNEAIKAIYRAATPLIQGILDDPPSAREKPMLMEQVNSFNDQIKAQNKKDGLDDKNLGQFLIQYTIFESNALLARPHWEKLKKGPDESALKKMDEIDKTLKNVITKNDYDSAWCYEALVEALFKPNGGNSSSPGQQNTGHGGGFSTTRKPASPQKSTVVKWKGPGYTLTGEKIIAMIPKTRTGACMVDGVMRKGVTYINGYQFILKDESEGTIELVSGASIGDRAKQGYLNLPTEQIKDARYSSDRYTEEHRELFHSLIDFTAMPFKTRQSDRPHHPPGYGLVRFTDGTEDILTRTALRGMLGRIDADFEIQEVLKANNKVPAWMIEPETMIEPRQMVIEKPTARRRRLEARVKGELPETAHEQLFVPPRNRTGERTTRRGSRSNSRSSARSDVSKTIALGSEVAEMRKEMQDLKEELKNLVYAMAHARV
ncbi:hypothetical protein BKA61DRAFT_683691 [Leptodontidium sp. MPI-SDFR-AT-0119]|nr:hypothetical protein BKA61DRAFT_683691 [Leptodontidium sp. MPI-SDFR-AT-0119]